MSASQCHDGKRRKGVFQQPQAHCYFLKYHHRLPPIDNYSESTEHEVYANNGHLDAKVQLAELYRGNNAFIKRSCITQQFSIQ